MVKELRRVIKRQGSYRFYSSSLLIIYDGAVTPQELTLNGKESRQGHVTIRGDPVVKSNDEAVRLNEEGEGVQHKDGGNRLERNGEMGEIENGGPSVGIVEDEGECVSSSHTVSGIRIFESSDLLHVNPTAPFRSAQHHLEDNQNRLNHRRTHDSVPLLLTETTPTNLNPTPPSTNSSDSDRHTHATCAMSSCCCHDDCKPHPSLPQSQEQVKEEDKLLTRVPAGVNHHGTVKNGYHKDRHHTHQEASRMCYISKTDLEVARKSIDLRMIDFAHSTHSGYNDSVVYSGPDEGYVQGLSSLVACFERMLSKSTS